MYQKIKKILERPKAFAKMENEFWNEEHISQQMLKAHLDPAFEGASRKLSFIEKSVCWIKELVPPSEYPLLLDVGCGPGIYAERFARAGFQVTGVDFSERSVEYAKKSAKRQMLCIEYHDQDYLDMELNREFDFATMIYCDYGALSPENRKTLLDKIYDHLKPGGKLLLDVFSMAQYDRFKERQTWEVCGHGGFWSADEYFALNGNYKYPDNVTLEQVSVFSQNRVAVYYLWNQYFTPKSLIEETTGSKFKVCDVFGDVAGQTYSEESPTIAILLKK